MSKRYSYVGPKSIQIPEDHEQHRQLVQSAADVRAWVAKTGQQADAEGGVTATFVIDGDGNLLIADRHSEHVAAAGGQEVLSAGEMTFLVGDEVEVDAVSNHSTGYCPEPESWPVVDEALTKLGLSHPASFTTEHQFRRCLCCGTTNLIKDEVYDCAVCRSPLSKRWNYQS